MATRKKRPHSTSDVLGPLQSPKISVSKVPSVPSLGLSNASGDAKTHIPCRKDREEIEELTKKLAEAEDRYNKLFFINEQTNIDLAHERHRVGQMERKLSFIKDNQHIFEKLKEAYMSMRYNETTSGRKLVEIRDKGVQTWEGIVCQACLGTEKLRAELERVRATYDDCILIKKDEMWKLTETVAKLKNYTQDFENRASKNERKVGNIPEVKLKEIEEKTSALLGLCNKEAMKIVEQGIVFEKRDAKKEYRDGYAVKAKVKEIEQKTAALLELSVRGTIMKRENPGNCFEVKEENTAKKKENKSRNKTERIKGAEALIIINKEHAVKTDNNLEQIAVIVKKNKKENAAKMFGQVGNAGVKHENEDASNAVGLRSPSAEEVNAEYDRHLKRLMEFGKILQTMAKASPKSQMQKKSAACDVKV